MLPSNFTPALLNQLELLKINSRRAFLGAKHGGHRSLKKGHGIEFSDYRQYERGDNPRHIDWGVYARSDRLYVKRFEEDQALSILIVIDTSASMFTPDGGKIRRARDAALALSYIALMSQDSVMIAAPGIKISPLVHGPRAIHNLGSEFFELGGGADARAGFDEDFRMAASRVKFPGIAVFISDFLMETPRIESMVNMLRAKNLDISGIQILGESDLDPAPGAADVLAVDSETGEEISLRLDAGVRDEYRALLNKHNALVRQYFGSIGAGFAEWLPKADLADFITRNLSKTGLVMS